MCRSRIVGYASVVRSGSSALSAREAGTGARILWSLAQPSPVHLQVRMIRSAAKQLWVNPFAALCKPCCSCGVVLLFRSERNQADHWWCLRF